VPGHVRSKDHRRRDLTDRRRLITADFSMDLTREAIIEELRASVKRFNTTDLVDRGC
jgi:hypothetical protein